MSHPDELERCYQTLEVYGVPRQRARTADNGIEVLVTRFNRKIYFNKVAISQKDALLAEMATAFTGIRNNCQFIDDPHIRTVIQDWCDDRLAKYEAQKGEGNGK